MSEWMAFFQIRTESARPPASRDSISTLTRDFFDHLPGRRMIQES